MPLTLLEEDQALSMATLPGCKPCILNSQSNWKSKYNDILGGMYTHILAGPEVLLSDTFAKLLQEKQLHDRLVLVAIDELHIVEQWGSKFHPAYQQLQSLRMQISRRVPWFGTSATLPPRVLPGILESAGFRPDVCVQRTSVDRPDIKLVVRKIKYAVGSYEDLLFLLEPFRKAVEASRLDLEHLLMQEEQVSTPQERSTGDASRLHCFHIPKTIVYVATITAITAVQALMVRSLQKLGCTLAAAKMAVKPYHSQLAEGDKRAISSQFSRPDVADALLSTPHRIVVATDAMGMGINNPDVRHVVQYGLPDGLSSLWQRAG
ncbi:MAG: hypothetical protein M1829_002577 [Trizodia sp. TS-e1964]|nr:MAG: hypothetical protein M1829_002577 [Trizodia sp. TS-e1964]